MSRKKNNLTLEDYESEFSYVDSKNDINISFNRVAFVFFIFLIVALVFSLKSTYFGFLEINNKKISIHKKDYRSSIVDRNGNILAKTVNTINVGINPNLVIDKKKLLLNLKIIFPNKNFNNFKKKFIKKKIFLFRKTSNSR